MIHSFQKSLLVAGFAAIACSGSAFAHLSYSGRDFGVFTGLESQSNTISTSSAVNAYSWADGTDDDFVHSHDIRFFKFSLANPTTVTISITAAAPLSLLPGFSLYSGLGHAVPDYETPLTIQYLATLPGPPKEGAFISTATWKMGNDESTSVADFSTFTYIGHAADGTAANYGTAPNINGDGLADGFVTASFSLAAGNYTIAIGGANYFAQGVTPPEGTNYGMSVTVAAVPEPATIGFLAVGALMIGAARRRLAK